MKVSHLIIILMFSVMLIGNSPTEQQKRYFEHRIKKGESVSLICIDYYGRYTPKMGDAIKRLNPVISDINLIHAGNFLKLQKPGASSKKSSREVKLFEKKVAVSQGVVTCVEGTAYLMKKGGTGKKNLTVNTLVVPGDVIETAANGRVEIIVNRESVVRMKENSRLTMEAFRDAPGKKGKTKCGLKGGTIWTKVKKFTGKLCRFELSLPTAVAGVYGTVYQTSLDKDSSAEVKVYHGEVAVKNQPSAQKATAPGEPGEVPGPNEVPGPHEVSMEEWTRIVRSMQKITIGKDGTPSAVTPFKKQPSDSWEQWNEERDKRIAELFSEQ